MTLRSSSTNGWTMPSSLGVWALIAVGRTISMLPQRVTSAVANLNDKGIRLYDSMRAPTYP